MWDIVMNADDILVRWSRENLGIRGRITLQNYSGWVDVEWN
jgi:hypothetical protein